MHEVTWVYRLDKPTLLNYANDCGITGVDDSTSIDSMRRTVIQFIREGNPLTPPEGNRPVSEAIKWTHQLVEKHINKLRSIDTTEPTQVFMFLKDCVELRKRNILSTSEFLKLLRLKCEGRVLDLINTMCVDGKFEFEDFHTKLINLAVPKSVEHVWLNEYVFRRQRPEESLHEFISDIISFDNVLRVNMTEETLVELILENLRDNVKAQCALLKIPSTIETLYEFADKVQGLLAGREKVKTVEKTPNYQCMAFARCEGNRQRSIPVLNKEEKGGFRSKNNFSFVKAPPRVLNVENTRCANCTVFGHKSADCPIPRLGYSERRCFRCLKVGHVKSNCTGNDVPLRVSVGRGARQNL